jgi:NAD(P) transhydrogenase
VVNTGVPGKAMRETALYVSGFQQRDLHGLNLAYDGTLTIDRFMHRGRAVRQALDQWIGGNLERHHVDVHHGRATFVDAYTVRVEGGTEPSLLEAGVILIATGSTPHRPSTIPFAGPGVYDSDTIQHMERLPRSLAIAAAPSAASTPASSRFWAWTRCESSTPASGSCQSPTTRSAPCSAR